MEYRLAQESTQMFEGCIELDEIYFIFSEYAKESAVEVRGKMAIFRHQGKVHTVVVPDAKSKTRIPIIFSKSSLIA